MDNVEVCTGCGRCEQSCIWAAISLTSYVEEARRRFLDASAVRRPQAALYCTAQSLKSGRIDQAGEEL
jgi:ferredoxin